MQRLQLRRGRRCACAAAAGAAGGRGCGGRSCGLLQLALALSKLRRLGRWAVRAWWCRSYDRATGAGPRHSNWQGKPYTPLKATPCAPGP
jgi:hypothetical protein